MQDTIDSMIKILDAEVKSYCSRNGENAWQTLKTFVLAQQTNNSESAPCEYYDKGEMCTRTHSYKCGACACQV